MFQRYKSYTHKNMLDAAILVLGVFRTRTGNYKLKIGWFNKRGMDLGFTERVTITKEQLPKWGEVMFSGDNAE